MKQPITCTSCHQRFQTWQNWLAHRATITPEEMGKHDNHTRRCLSLHDWAMLVLSEALGAQEAVASSGQEDVQAQSHSEGLVHAREGLTVSGLVNYLPLSENRPTRIRNAQNGIVTRGLVVNLWIRSL